MYSGTLIDSQTETGIPSATVRLSHNGTTIAQTFTNAAGYFELPSFIPGTHLVFSSAGYKTWAFPASIYQKRFELERNEIELPPVIVTTPPKPKKKTSPIVWALLAVVTYKIISDGK